jgi:hypothetical protein
MGKMDKYVVENLEITDDLVYMSSDKSLNFI